MKYKTYKTYKHSKEFNSYVEAFEALATLNHENTFEEIFELDYMLFAKSDNYSIEVKPTGIVDKSGVQQVIVMIEYKILS